MRKLTFVELACQCDAFDIYSPLYNTIFFHRALMCLLLQLSLVLITLVGLAILRSDASRLVIYPLRRMLKIVLRCTYFSY
jgi:hypothetical protein